jgi:hypothetical protein
MNSSTSWAEPSLTSGVTVRVAGPLVIVDMPIVEAWMQFSIDAEWVAGESPSELGLS